MIYVYILSLKINLTFKIVSLRKVCSVVTKMDYCNMTYLMVSCDNLRSFYI